MDLITVCTYDSPAEAHMAKNLLEAEGIQAFINAEEAGDAFVHVGGLSKIELQVDNQHAARAREILDEVEEQKQAEAETEEDGESEVEDVGEEE